MKTRILLFMLASFQYVLFAQKTIDVKNPSGDESSLFAHSWNLAELNGASTAQPGVKQAYLTFQRDDFNYNRMSGFTGCNYVGGRIDLLEDGGIVFRPDLITNNNCAGGSVESSLMEVLLNADKWSDKNGQLLLSRKGKVIAKWNPSLQPNTTLKGAWELVYINGLASPFSEVFPETHCPKIIFQDRQHTVSGYAGCHEFTTPFLINQHTIVFTGSTPCDTSCQVKEDNIFLQTLSSVNAYVFKDDKTLVFINDDEPVMAFSRMKTVPASPATASQE